MNPNLPILLLSLLFTTSLALEAPISNITVIGSVFCDACSSNSFSNHSYFLRGVKVLVDCKFTSNSTSREDVSITAERTTDRFGIYTLRIPPVDGFECREGWEIQSFCRASLVGSSSSLCNVPGLRVSTEHVAVKCVEATACVFNLNALNYRPSKMNAALCGTNRGQQPSSNQNTSLFFWPPFPPFGFPFPPLPFFPPPQVLPFPPLPFFPPPSVLPLPPLPFFPPPPVLPLPPLPFFPPPPVLPFPPLPFFPPPPALPFPPLPIFPPPPALPFPPLPPLPFFPTPPPPPPLFPPLPPLPPFPPLFPSPPPLPPPPSFPFPLPPFPPFAPIPPLFAPPPPPPPPPPPSFPFPFPPLPPLIPSPGQPSPPPPLS